ncbi:hypothetical protein ATG_07600 [Desulfurococcaceae archaeon AG1]|jgi:vacuolar-type H+-ATPase subunit C/Vma6|nr:MAG: hypothetical protein DJ555_04755 [Desulfurococcaceae archaeon]GAY25557.1 hypothetical protein ATG_07600 [Desulfurococcaceae archaeon AG1]
MDWDIYAAVRARIIYAGRLSRDIIEDAANAGSVADAINYLRESSYYAYIRNVPAEQIDLLELSLYLGLYKSLAPLLGLVDKSYRSIAEHGLLMIENRIFSSILQSIVSGTSLNIDLKLFEDTRLGEAYRIAVEERSITKLLEYMSRIGMKDFVTTYNALTKAVDMRKAIPIATDLGLVKSLSRIIEDFPSLAEMVCPENDYIVINTAIRLSRERLKDYIGAEELSQLACSVSKSEIEDLYSYVNEEAILNTLKKIYGPTLVQKDLENSLINIRKYIRRTVRDRCDNAMISYPFDPKVIWASIRIRMLDIEDIITIINGKKAGFSSDLIKKMLSI